MILGLKEIKGQNAYIIDISGEINVLRIPRKRSCKRRALPTELTAYGEKK